MPSSTATLLTLRRLILLLLGVGLAATALEFWLVAHHDDTRLRVPLMVTIPALRALAWYAAAPGLVSVSMPRPSSTSTSTEIS